MLESLAALRESAQPSPTPASQSNIPEELPVDLRSLEALSGPSSLTTFELTSPRESTAPSPLPVPPAPRTPSVSATSRFSTVVGNRSQERILIDLSESEDEGEDGGDGDDARASDEIEHDPVVGASDDSTIAEAPDVEREIAPRSDNVIQETEAPLPEMSDLERRAAAGSVTVIAGEVDSGESTSSRTVDRVSVEHDRDVELEPPFVTDGRGRVVWSSTRSSGRGTRVQVQGQAETVSRESPGQGQVQVQGAVRTPAGTTTASERRTKARRTVTAREPSSDPTAITTESTGFTTDGRGRVIWTAGNPPSPALQIPTPAGDTAGSGAAQVNAVQLEGCSEPRADAEIEGGMGTENVVADENWDDDGSRRSFFGRVLDVVFLNS
jgi:E3 ubiquitin-protein ligase makorin